MSSASEPRISWTVPTRVPSLANTGLPYLTPRHPTGSATGCLLRGGGSAATSIAEFNEELDLELLDVVGGLEAEDLGVERQLRAERADDRVVAAEAVVLARVEQVRVRDSPLEQRVDDPLRLRRRHDSVFGPLLDEHGP